MRPFTTTGQRTVGTAIRIEHLRATGGGGWVDVIAEPSAAAAGRRLTFLVRAMNSSGELVATGEIDRAIVDRRRFLATTSAQGRPNKPTYVRLGTGLTVFHGGQTCSFAPLPRGRLDRRPTGADKRSAAAVEQRSHRLLDACPPRRLSRTARNPWPVAGRGVRSR
ncbi:thioesterase family protein [Streptomyces sp. NPDC051644]|uniref:thioesterase family protein n=1 Tax=Streptomyces sp. NPDC051644 TaxID=3365666 RepID=UPI003788F88C